ncbi:helix-turn-helix domain-containing protein [Amycolatopsis lurida]
MPKSTNTIGQRIQQMRKGWMTQQELATAANVSVDVIRKLEQGQRHTATIANLHSIANALDRDIADLFGRQAFPESDAGVQALRRAVTDVSDLLGTFEGEALTTSQAERRAKYLWGAYWAGQYDLLTSLIPPTLLDLQATLHDANVEDSPKAADALARAYWVAGCTLAHLHQSDAAFISIRRAVEESKKANDELLAATLRGSVSWQFLVAGRYIEAEELAKKTAATIEPSGSVSDPHLSVYGSLIITSATAAARRKKAQEANDLLSTSREVASRIGYDRDDYQTPFGPSQVTMQTVDVGVVTENYDAAIRAAKEMSANPGLPLAARARHLTDRAFAHLRMGDDEKATKLIYTIDDLAPDWIQHQTLAKQVARELRVRQAKKSQRLNDLIRRIGADREIA